MDKGKMVLAGVAGLIVLACGGGATTSSGGSGTTVAGGGAAKSAALADVAITGCAISANQFSGPEATLKVTNNSSKASNYLIQIAFLSKDGATQIDTGSAVVNGLAPGQSSTETATSLKSDAKAQAAAGFTCKVLDVTRYAS